MQVAKPLTILLIKEVVLYVCVDLLKLMQILLRFLAALNNPKLLASLMLAAFLFSSPSRIFFPVINPLNHSFPLK